MRILTTKGDGMGTKSVSTRGPITVKNAEEEEARATLRQLDCRNA